MAKKSPAPKKQTQPTVSSLAARVLSGDLKPNTAEIKRLAASALSQDERKGQKKPR